MNEEKAHTTQEKETRPAWHTPEIEEVSLQRTLLFIGSGSDSVGRTTV